MNLKKMAKWALQLDSLTRSRTSSCSISHLLIAKVIQLLTKLGLKYFPERACRILGSLALMQIDMLMQQIEIRSRFPLLKSRRLSHNNKTNLPRRQKVTGYLDDSWFIWMFIVTLRQICYTLLLSLQKGRFTHRQINKWQLWMGTWPLSWLTWENLPALRLV